MDRLRALEAWGRDQVDAMSPRDRMLGAALVLLVQVAVVGAATWFLVDRLEDLESRVTVARDGLTDVRDLVGEYQVLDARVQAAEARMGQFRANQMNTYLEGWASQAGVAGTLQVRPGAASTVGDYAAVPYQVSIDRAELGSLLSFLYALETAPYPIKVRTARFKVDERNKERMLDLNLEVVAYSKEEG